jgi:hypothetical protein
VQAARAEIGLVVQGLTAADTATATPGFARARAQRLAVDEMRSQLTRLVAVEARFTADSGGPRATPGAAMPPMGNNIGPYIRLAFDGWLAWTTNIHADVWCAVAVGPDTQWIGNAPSGQPVCFGANVPALDIARIQDQDYARYLRATGQSR